MSARLRFGYFLAPFHPPGRSPLSYLQQDLDLMVHLDRLGFDEAWIGEHHSSGWEIIACPEIFIATAAERTRHIRFGTGVISLPYHHPFMVADRMVLLDHLTRGRLMMGVGPGALVGDALMMGIDPYQARRRMEEATGAIIGLLESEEPVSMETDWFTLKDAKLQLQCYQEPRFEVCSASIASPSGARLAGQYGLGILSLAASEANGFEFLRKTWALVEERAAEFGRQVSRKGWRLVTNMHVAPTLEQAKEDMRYGFVEFIRYRQAGPFKIPNFDFDNVDIGKLVDEMNASGVAVIGTPDMAIAQIERLQKQTGGFGALLITSQDQASPEATLRSCELIAREVIPAFNGALDRPKAAWDKHWAGREYYGGAFRGAQDLATKQHEAEQAGKKGNHRR